MIKMMSRKEYMKELFKRKSWLEEEIEELGKVLSNVGFLGQITESFRYCENLWKQFSKVSISGAWLTPIEKKKKKKTLHVLEM